MKTVSHHVLRLCRASFVFTLLFLLVGGTPPAVSHSGCLDRGESSGGAVRVLEGEAGWLSCPLFSHPSIYNFTSAQSAGHTLLWHRTPQGHGLQQPVPDSWRISRDEERLWLQPANGNDTGRYTCTLSNSSFCSRMSLRLRVLPPDRAVRSSACEPAVAVATQSISVPLQSDAVLDCPELQEAQRSAEEEEAQVTWSHLCGRTSFTLYREQKGGRLQIHVMLSSFEGLYFCRVQFRRTGRLLHFTRSLNVSAIYSEVSLLCRGSFPFINSSWEIWWTVDGKTLDQLAGQHRFSRADRQERYVHGDRWEDSVLRIHDFQPQDLNREYNCSVRNDRGFETRRVRLELEGEPL
ncbi:Interleukin-1 receptor accessory protein [Liparis tanakae]|uniref:Interleukin-1 receptor accessory protein n=1 Tax=Liparis tanakae TaxID=230148 RepID=A0A4Z2EML3_9TELE|nr:Interleukin-1 receptor accessory protein [Liparis tanakae]